MAVLPDSHAMHEPHEYSSIALAKNELATGPSILPTSVLYVAHPVRSAKDASTHMV